VPTAQIPLMSQNFTGGKHKSLQKDGFTTHPKEYYEVPTSSILSRTIDDSVEAERRGQSDNKFFPKS